MRFHPTLEAYRIHTGPFGTHPFDDCGAFRVPGPCQRELMVIASSGIEQLVDWEHVSVSLPNRCPNWLEMCHVKSLFWDDEEAVMQLHPPKSQWINNHQYCLHLWRPKTEQIPLPPDIAVGNKELGTLK